MDSKTVVSKIKKIGVVPVLTIPDSKLAVRLANALVDGGIPVVEVMLRNEEALKSIKNISENCPDILVGAGTVLNVEQVDAAMANGAEFIVSPGFDPKLVSYCLEKNYPIVPGVATPSEVQCALAMGLTALKFFPAGVPGGIETLKNLHGPFPQAEFLCTGSVNSDNYLDFLALPHVFASYVKVAPPELIMAEKFDEITANCREAIARIFDIKIAHVGINCDNEKDSLEFAKIFSKILNVPIIEYPNCNFAGTLLEINKTPGKGKNGHIGLLTNDLDRLAAYAEDRGLEFDWDNALYFPGTKKVKCVYFKNDIAGFAFHLLQKS